jgi:alcohol dehydrogenase class IV
MSFEFATATRIVFGAGALAGAGPAARGLGRRALVLIGKSAGALQRAEPLLGGLTEAAVDFATFSVLGEPTLETVRAGVAHARHGGCDMVIGFGGGSVLDAAKAIAALLTNDGDPFEYLEVIGHGRPLQHPAAPCLAIPTTAGTGSEVTRNAVLGSPAHRLKVSLRSPLMLPRVALIDPTLTHSLPPRLTATTGLDALTQLIEPLVSRKANPLTDAICREGMRRAARSLRRACEHGDDADARHDMALASLFGGLALANAALGAVHGLAGPIGGMFDAPHGAVVAALLPHVMAVNLEALRQTTADETSRAVRDTARQRFEEVARILTGRAAATAEDAVAWLRELSAALNVSSLAGFGVRPEHFDELAEKAAAASSMQGNPVALSAAHLRQILARAL